MEMRKIEIRKLLLSLAALTVLAGASWYAFQALNPGKSASATPPKKWPTTAWATATPESKGFDSTKLAEALLTAKQSGMKIHSLTLVSGGDIFLDAYFYPYDNSTYHDYASVTKSVTTTLIGIAADRGELDLDDPILEYFPNLTVANRDGLKEKVTIRHLAGMTSGFACIDYPEEMTLAEMQASSDWVQFALDRPMATEPGEIFVYDSLGSHLLSAILEEATGKTALEYAQEHLFTPLGISEICWPADPQGHSRGAGDLSLHPRDAAKIGLLFQQGGNWDGVQIVSKEWVDTATSKHISTNRGQDYGYGWWISAPSEPYPYYSAEGRNGQYIRIYPTLDLIISATGSGFDMGELGPLLAEAISGDKPLPANPSGEDDLRSAITEVAAKPTPTPLSPLPEIVTQISGRTYEFDENPIGLLSMRIDYINSSEMSLTLKLANEADPRVSIVGLDGVYRLSSSGRPVAARGRWSSDTFEIQYNEGPGLNNLNIHLEYNVEDANFVIVGLGSVSGHQVSP